MSSMLTRANIEKMYPVGSTVKVGIRSFVVKGYDGGRGWVDVVLSRPFINGKMAKAGFAVDDEKNIILRGWAEKINY